jgi:hypothetical protein
MFLILFFTCYHLEKREGTHESTPFEQCQQSTANFGAKQCKYNGSEEVVYVFHQFICEMYKIYP